MDSSTLSIILSIAGIVITIVLSIIGYIIGSKMVSQEYFIKTMATVVWVLFFTISLILVLIIEIFFGYLNGQALADIAATWFIIALVLTVGLIATEFALAKYRKRQNLTLIIAFIAGAFSVANLIGLGLSSVDWWETTAVFGAVLTLITWAFVNMVSA